MAYRDVEYSNDNYSELLDPADDEEKIELNSLAEDMTTLYEELCNVRKVVLINRVKPLDKPQPEKKNEESKLKTKKLDAPTFSGNLREYPTFKRDYERHMHPVYGNDAYALRGCLKGNAEKVVRGVEDNYQEMFHRLDKKYGCEEKLVDSVMGELKGLKRIQEGDVSKFVKFVEIVESAWLDLSKMGMQAEMDTAMMISQVEKLLPLIQRREWAIYRQQSDGKQEKGSFKMMMKFLIQEKNAIEYMTDDLRWPEYVTKGNSNFAELNQIEVEDKSGRGVVDEMQFQMKIVIDGLAQVAQAISNSSFEGRNPYRSNTPRNNRQYSNQFSNLNPYNYAGMNSRKKCWFHNVDDHEIQNCNAFKALELPARMEAVRKQFACFNCLKPGHVANRTWPKATRIMVKAKLY